MLPSRPAVAAPLLVACALLSGAPARAQCPEPSAVDVRPSAPPLTVRREGPALALAWEDVAVAAYEVHAGSLGALHAGGYDHAPVAASAVAAATLPAPAGDVYLLVGAACGVDGSSLGRDSAGRERPRPRPILVTVALRDAPAAFGFSVEIAHPPDLSPLPASTTTTGPFERGAAGTPLVASSSPADGVVALASTFTEFDPDPSVDAPPAPGVEVATFAYSSPLPDVPSPGDFTLTQCDVRDNSGARLPGATCAITRVER